MLKDAKCVLSQNSISTLFILIKTVNHGRGFFPILFAKTNLESEK